MSNPSDLNPDLSAQIEGSIACMISEGGAMASRPPKWSTDSEQPTNSSNDTSAASDSSDGGLGARSPVSSRLNRVWTKVAHYALERVAQASANTPPDVLEKACRRARLAEDLLTEVKEGTYCHISKPSIAFIGSGMALASKLGELSGRTVTRIGSACLSMLVTEVSEGDLRRYCRFKNYELQHYFG